jgi:hypothetical protein
MKTEFFPAFMRINYPDIEITNEEAIEIGNEFKRYLLEKFKGEEYKLEKWWDIEPIKVILNKEHPLKVNGYEPALILHFGEFVKQNAEAAV